MGSHFHQISSIPSLLKQQFPTKKTKMEDFIFRGFLSSSLLLSLFVVFKVAHTFWLKPKSQEKRLRKQGIRGTPYKILNGDMKEFARSSKEARSRPIALNQEIAPRVLPFFYKMVQIYGEQLLHKLSHVFRFLLFLGISVHTYTWYLVLS
jgi:hypothetical protein